MKASFNTTTVFLIVAFGTMTFIFFGVNAFMDITQSADVVSENIELLNAVDAVHLLKACLEGGDGAISEQDASQFSKSGCESVFPALSGLDYEYRIVGLEDNAEISSSGGYDPESSMNRHIIYINIARDNGEIYMGRLYVQTG